MTREVRPEEQPAHEILGSFTPDLVAFLADLHGAPDSLAQATVQLLPFGSRAALQATGLAVWREARKQGVRHRRLTLTAVAFDVMAEAAARADQEEIATLTSTARAVAQRCHGGPG